MQMSPVEFHRQIRSLFSFLRILVRDSAAGRKSVDDYAAHLEGRISTLARVHQMLMRTPAQGIDLEELLCGELLGNAAPESQYRVQGPEIRICPEAATSIGLAFHELAMNAMTHGAFASTNGRAEVTWSSAHEQDGHWLRLEWIEHGVALNGTPAPAGFGRELIERMLPYELNARTSFQFAPEGIQVELLVPANATGVNWRPGREEAS